MVIFVICELLNLQFQLRLIEYAAFPNSHLLNVSLKAHTFYMPISELMQARRQEEGIFIIPRECNTTIRECTDNSWVTESGHLVLAFSGNTGKSAMSLFMLSPIVKPVGIFCPPFSTVFKSIILASSWFFVLCWYLLCYSRVQLTKNGVADAAWTALCRSGWFTRPCTPWLPGKSCNTPNSSVWKCPQPT